MLKAEWAYDFACTLPLSAIGRSFDAAGPWQWQLRDSDFYGDYLNCRPMEHVRLRVHEYPSTGRLTFPGPRLQGFKALLEIGPESTSSRGEIDAVFRRLLDAIKATEVTEIERYD